MAPIYDIRDPEPLSDDDSFEVLDVINDLLNENADSPSDNRADGCTERALHDSLQPKNAMASKEDGDEVNEMKSCEATGNSELPPEGDSAKVTDAQNNVFSGEILEKSETANMEHDLHVSLKSNEPSASEAYDDEEANETQSCEIPGNSDQPPEDDSPKGTNAQNSLSSYEMLEQSETAELENDQQISLKPKDPTAAKEDDDEANQTKSGHSELVTEDDSPKVTDAQNNISSDEIENGGGVNETLSCKETGHAELPPENDSTKVTDAQNSLSSEEVSRKRDTAEMEHALNVSLQPKDPTDSKEDGDKSSETKICEETGHLELPPEDDSTKMMNAQNNVFSDGILEESETVKSQDSLKPKEPSASKEDGDKPCETVICEATNFSKLSPEEGSPTVTDAQNNDFSDEILEESETVELENDLHVSLKPKDSSPSEEDGDKANQTQSCETTGYSELPAEDDSTKVTDAQNNVFNDNIQEKRETAESEHAQATAVTSPEMGDGDKLKRLERLASSGIDTDLLLSLITDVVTRSTTVKTDSNEQNCTPHGISELSRSGNSSEKKTQTKPSAGDLRKESTLTAVPVKAILPAEHQEKSKAKNITLESIGKFSSPNGKEYIKAKGPSSSKMPQLGFSARLTYGQLNLAIHNQGSLLVTDDNFVARVKLDRPHLLIGTRHFYQANTVLLNELRIDQVLLDEVTADRDKHRQLFLTSLEQVIKQLAADEGPVNTRLDLLRFFERSQQRTTLTYVALCREVMNNRFMHKTLQKHAEILESTELQALQRDKLFQRFRHFPKDNSPNLSMRLNNLAMEVVDHHRRMLLAKAPACLRKPLGSFGPKYLLLISSSDVKLFSDMFSTLKPEIFEKPLEDLANRWINRVRSIKANRLNKPLQLTNASLFFICKSLEEVIIEIMERTNHRATDLLTISYLGWYPIKRLVWKTENTFTKCLEREYHFIFRLLKHFEAASDFGLQPFQYEMQLFTNGQSASRGLLGGVKNALVRTGQALGMKRLESNPFGVPDDFYIWYCLLDDVLFHVLPNGCELDLFENVFKGYVQMIRDAKYDEMETLRVVTHNLTRFIAQSWSCNKRTPLDASLDKAVLLKQLDIFSFKTIKSVDSSKNFRDQVDVFNSFWKTRSDIIDQLPMKINLPEMLLMQERLMKIMLIVLDKDVEVETRVAFFRTYNDFLIDLNDVSFDWYVKDIPDFDMQPVIHLGKVELVDNKWKDTNNRTYRVLNPENFPTLCKGLGLTGDVPKHYVIEVIQTLLEHIGSQLQRSSWANDDNLSDTDQVLTTNELIFAIRNSFLYLKEQIDYVSFDLFYDERVKPFASVLNTTTSRQDFLNRIYLIKESFWYIRKQNEISFEDALQLYNELNSSHELKAIRESYAIYSKFFEEFMQLSVDEGHSERASLIAEKVKDQYSNTTLFKTWTDRFKQEKVPEILAGLAAVWSILVSKDVAKAGKYFNPHCIQILCILRLLSVDKAERGIDKHLAQVLTGQGKSLVLGLLAALFALTGHRVRIACYSKYLAERDEQDFLTFFEMFEIDEDVTYGTFDDLANENIKPTVDGQTFELRNLVNDLLFKEKAILPHQLVTADSSNDVLLMDEVDVFFTKEFYGNSYYPCSTPIIPGLDNIQEQIWSYVTAGWTDVESRIHQYIRSDEFEHRDKFLEFLDRANNYSLIKLDGVQTTFTNKTLFDEHVRMMVRDATNVKNGWLSTSFKLSSTGVITYNHRGIYTSSTFCDYQNVFNYFRLKKENFVTKVNGKKNYGYLMIDCGSLSYAMLPMNYPLIVGVSGTLSSLNQFEKDTIEKLYNIKQTSLMPTFFGCSNLQFHKVANFHHHATKPSWRTNIFSQANQMITANRAVIVFFKTDVELNAFEAEYAGQLDRVNVLTENTEDKERFISEAGVAKTITLATRGMGRGVDYKSSVTVEKNGGIHVIQTFFSMDVKEETQIKGRTARKDNKGSYELIVCDEDLKSDGLMSGLNCVTYAELDTARSKISLDENAELSKKIQEGMGAHRNTMNYMKSFYKTAYLKFPALL